MNMSIDRDAVVLFQGDSITHAFRDEHDPDDLGRGYALIAAARLGSEFPERNLRFVNRGICGNTVRDLRERWREDCLDLQPDWVSILIGVNDTWRRFDEGRLTTAEEYEETYRHILTKTRDTLGAKLVLCEPFLLPHGDHSEAWREDLDPKIKVVRKLAQEFGAIHVSLDSLFAAACSRRETDYWSWDGVHVRPSGHGIIARAWLESVGVA
jgi:lysophospholipase L1-like esterase